MGCRLSDGAILTQSQSGSYFYFFVHSYALEVTDDPGHLRLWPALHRHQAVTTSLAIPPESGSAGARLQNFLGVTRMIIPAIDLINGG